VKLLLAILIGLVLAAAGFAGGWVGRGAHDKGCYVLPAYTDLEPSQSDPLGPKVKAVNPPELVCK
jgi:hypothetical protein